MKAHLGPIACVWVVMAALAGGAGPAAGSAVIFVDADAGGASNGTSWADAYTSVQPALSAAQPGDQVWVAAGVYVENITLALGVALYGGFAGIEDPVTFNLADRDFVVNETTLDGNHAGSVVTGPPGATETTRIDGFTITNGSGTNVVGTTTEGGGVYLDESSPAIENNVIRGNSVTGDGGGLRLGSSAPLIAHNTIRANNGRYGGGLSLGASSPTIIENQIHDNLATRSGGAPHVRVAGCTSALRLH